MKSVTAGPERAGPLVRQPAPVRPNRAAVPPAEWALADPIPGPPGQPPPGDRPNRVALPSRPRVRPSPVVPWGLGLPGNPPTAWEPVPALPTPVAVRPSAGQRPVTGCLPAPPNRAGRPDALGPGSWSHRTGSAPRARRRVPAGRPPRPSPAVLQARDRSRHPSACRRATARRGQAPNRMGLRRAPAPSRLGLPGTHVPTARRRRSQGVARRRSRRTCSPNCWRRRTSGTQSSTTSERNRNPARKAGEREHSPSPAQREARSRCSAPPKPAEEVRAARPWSRLSQPSWPKGSRHAPARATARSRRRLTGDAPGPPRADAHRSLASLMRAALPKRLRR